MELPFAAGVVSRSSVFVATKKVFGFRLSQDAIRSSDAP